MYIGQQSIRRATFVYQCPVFGVSLKSIGPSAVDLGCAFLKSSLWRLLGAAVA